MSLGVIFRISHRKSYFEMILICAQTTTIPSLCGKIEILLRHNDAILERIGLSIRDINLGIKIGLNADLFHQMIKFQFCLYIIISEFSFLLFFMFISHAICLIYMYRYMLEYSTLKCLKACSGHYW